MLAFKVVGICGIQSVSQPQKNVHTNLVLSLYIVY